MHDNFNGSPQSTLSMSQSARDFIGVKTDNTPSTPTKVSGLPWGIVNRIQSILSSASSPPYRSAGLFGANQPIMDFPDFTGVNTSINKPTGRSFADLYALEGIGINTKTLPASMLPQIPDINSIKEAGTNLANRVQANNPTTISPIQKLAASANKNYDKWSTGLNIANTAFTGLFGEKSEYSGDQGDITQTLDSNYDTVQDLAGSLGPYGKLISLGMGANKFLGNVANKLGAGTSGMTTTDSILGSSFLQLTPFGLVNGFGGKKADTITKDTQAFETVGTSYSGSNQAINDALSKSGKKYGLFSSGARKRANRLIADAKMQQSIITDIADNTMDRRNIQSSMAAINGNNYAFQLQGGYDQGAIRYGRKGLKIDRARVILDKYKKQQTNQLQQGGPIDPFEYYLESLPENQRDSTNFRVKDYWIFNGKPKDFEEARRKGMFTQEKDGWHAHTIAWNPETGEGEFMKSPDHPSIQQEIDWYNSDDGSKFRSEYELVKSSPYWKYVKRQQKEVPSHKNGGTFIEISIETSIELVDPMTIPEFQNGGSINVIPDGALHARKHNMDVDGITKKGIPVVSEKDGKIEQHAEIEKEEIILRLEVTQKLEELEKKFYSEESTQEEKDGYALEAGKLLVNEILYNTQDNTNNLL